MREQKYVSEPLRIEYVHSCTSTLDILAEPPYDALEAPFALMTLDQRAGHGRQGRRWQNRPGESLALTVAWPLPAPQLRGWYPLASALAVLDTCAEVAPGAPLPGLKWPNDILSPAGEKIAGILVRVDAGRLLAGVGVNLAGTIEREHEGLEKAATLASLDSRYGAALSDLEERREFGEVLARNIARIFALVDSGGRDFRDLRTRYAVNCLTLGSRVVVVTPAGARYDAHALDVDPTGRLLVENAERGRHALDAADVHLARPGGGESPGGQGEKKTKGPDEHRSRSRGAERA